MPKPSGIDDLADFPLLPPPATLRVCPTCGAVVPAGTVTVHRRWHADSGSLVVELHQRIGRVEGNRR